MRNKKLIAIAVAALCAVSTAPVLGAVIDNRASEIIGAGVVADPLLAVEGQRSAIVERMAAEHRIALALSGIDEQAFRNALYALRADQLLTASLVSSLAEVSAIVETPPSEGRASLRYVAVVPASALAALPAADAYLVREGEALSVVKAAQLHLSATTQLVGYFVGAGSGQITRKDGPGSGANSWIGYTAGNNVASGAGSAVAAGTFNAATGLNAAVFAGQSNVASGTSSLVIGGFDNQATAIDALIGAGAGHRATGARSVVVGGGYNLASGNWSFVGGGGRQNGSGVAGANAEDNVASGNFSVVTGGQGNRATGTFATVPGGTSNLASGVGSFAAGNRAKTQTAGGSPVIHDGTFAFADGNAFDFNTAVANEFAVRATGGVRFITAIDGTGASTRTTQINNNGSVIAGGNFGMAITSPSRGSIYQNGIPLIHTFGTSNMFAGSAAGNFLMTGANNSGFGAGTLGSNTTGFENTAVGAFALASNTTGFWNTATGSGALGLNTTGQRNTAHGLNALHFNTTGSNNTGSGFNSLQNNTTGNNNTATGSDGLRLNTTGNNNTVVGAFALNNNSTGSGNTGTGAGVLSANTIGQFNTGVGAGVLSVSTTAQGNTGTGVNALAQTTGDNNTAVGREALALNTSGTLNTAIGYSASAAGNNFVNATAVGANAVVDASNHVRIGDANVTQIGGQVAWTNLSDKREKKDIRELSLGLAFVTALRPVEYRMRNGNDRLDLGFLAQDVEALVGTSYNVLGIGPPPERKLSLRYTDLIAPMVKAIQEQQAQIDEQRALIASQQARLVTRDLELAELRRAVEVLMARTASSNNIARAE